MKNLKIVQSKYIVDYKNELSVNIPLALEKVNEAELSPKSFTFYTSVSVVASSKIEGEAVEIDSYMKHKMLNVQYIPEYIEKPNDLFEAYTYAQEHKLCEKTFLETHKLITAHLIVSSARGRVRQNEMVVLQHETGRIQYEAAQSKVVSIEFEKLFADIAILLKAELNETEIFYYAAFIHLVFVNIHPFEDGNGRAARLLEKWFLSQKIGKQAWSIASEKYYYQHVDNYYRNLARLGMFYNELEYEKCLPFLLMLPNSMISKNK